MCSITTIFAVTSTTFNVDVEGASPLQTVAFISSNSRLTKSCTGPDVPPFSIHFLPYFSAHSSLHPWKVCYFRKCSTVEKGCGGIVKRICTLWILQRSAHPTFDSISCKINLNSDVRLCTFQRLKEKRINRRL